MTDKVEATNKEREGNIKKDLQQLKNRYDDVNSQIGSLEKRLDTMSKNQAESSGAIQTKLDAILRKFYLTRKTGSGSHARHQS